MKFSELSNYFFFINKESSRLKITELLADLFMNLNAKEARIVSYLSLGTLRAPYEASQFNFAQKNLEKALSNLLEKDLIEYKTYVKESGDIGLSIQSAHWPYSDSGLTINQVYDLLCNLQSISGVGAQEEKSVLLASLLKQCDSLSASFIVRIIIGTMRLGFSDMTLIDSFSWMIAKNKSLHSQIEEAYNLCADLGLIALKLKELGIDGLKEIKPTVGIPIRLAAAERATSPEAIFERLGPCVAQPKLDGFRLQIHILKSKLGNKIWFYSRNLQDMSNMFPDLTQALNSLPVESVIMEGEAIVFDEQTQSFLPFQETVKRKRKHGIEEVLETLPLKLFLFDILYVNGEIVLNKTHTERREILYNIFTDFKSDQIKIIEEKFCNSSQELLIYFNEQISSGLEGLVVKRPDSPYQPGKRNFNWIKLKRHDQGHLDDSIDAVVLGYYSGQGKRADFGIGAFLVGVYNKEKDRFETVAKIGTGLKDDEWKELKLLCDEKKSIEQPHNVVCAKELAPDVWVNPQIVVIILADEITQSPMHAAGKSENQLGLALRFPRFMGYSQDKLPEQATSVIELRELYNLQFNKK